LLVGVYVLLAFCELVLLAAVLLQFEPL